MVEVESNKFASNFTLKALLQGLVGTIEPGIQQVIGPHQQAQVSITINDKDDGETGLFTFNSDPKALLEQQILNQEFVKQ
jgi:hypothetical protein